MDQQAKAVAADWVKRQGAVRTYQITVAEPAPSMSEKRYPFTGEYWQAVALAQRIHLECGRTVYVVGSGLVWLHRCRKMVSTDVNTNSGVPAESAIVPADLTGPLLTAEGGAL